MFTYEHLTCFVQAETLTNEITTSITVESQMASEDALPEANAKIAFICHNHDVLQKELEMHKFCVQEMQKNAMQGKTSFFNTKVDCLKMGMFWQRPIKK